MNLHYMFHKDQNSVEIVHTLYLCILMNIRDIFLNGDLHEKPNIDIKYSQQTD